MIKVNLIPIRVARHKYFLCVLLLISIILSFPNVLLGQGKPLSTQYVGFLPSVLLEPYDTVNAVEANVLPLVYEFRWGKQNEKSVQVRPIINYRFLKNNSGISHLGGTLVTNRYLVNMFREGFWLKPQLGGYYTHSYNRLDKVQTMTLGIELGAFMILSNRFSFSMNLQPGINYYPDPFSRSFADAKNGFKPHFGFIFHVGYNF
ncbi:MAG: hypothetical protein ACMVP2_19810 [Imperialibacter sp.]|uniref:hypothetical protein n=1 Tax=Imperialibacter sp. TaxID=2038411 RepID=UPI003A8BC4B8